MIDASFLHELQRFNLIVNKRVTSKYVGEKKSSFSGSGTIFRDHRIYAMGDNFKAIDWKVYARTDDMYIKLFEEERNLNVHILIDSSASMKYKDKFDYAGKLGLGFAFLALKNNEKIHFSTFSDSLENFRGSRGKGQILTMLNHLNSIKQKGKSNLFDSFMLHKKNIRSKSFIVIVSDFMIDPKEIVDTLQLISREHTVKIIQVLDKEEKDMPLEGDYDLIDSETDFKLRTYISKRAQKDYVDELNKHVSQIKDVCNKLGFSFYQFTTDKPIFDTFFELVR